MLKRALSTLLLLPLFYLSQPSIAAQSDSLTPKKESLAEIIDVDKIPFPIHSFRYGEFKPGNLESALEEDAKIEIHGKRSDAKIILIPFMHPKSSELGIAENEDIFKVSLTCKDIASKAFDLGLADTMVFEGITPNLAKIYQEDGKLSIRAPSGDNSPTFVIWSAMFNSKKWKLAGLETELKKNDTYMHLLSTKFELSLRLAGKTWDEKGYFDSKEIFSKNKEKIEDEIKDINKSYLKSIKNYFKNIDPKGKSESYRLTTYREEGMAKEALKTDIGAIIIFGAVHEKGIRDYLERQNKSYYLARIPNVPIINATEKEVLRIARINMVSPGGVIEIKMKDGTLESVGSRIFESKIFEQYISPGTKYKD